MEQISAPAKKRLTAFGKRARQKRIFARLREGWAYDEIAREERLTAARVRQIVSEVLQKRQVDDSMAHALLQLSRLGPAVQLAGEAVARGDLQAIWPLLGALDRLDRYQKDARAIHRDNEEIREKLYAKITRLAEADDRKYGPRPEPEPDEWESPRRRPRCRRRTPAASLRNRRGRRAASPTDRPSASAPCGPGTCDRPCGGGERGGRRTRRKPLKSPDSEKEMQGNANIRDTVCGARTTLKAAIVRS